MTDERVAAEIRRAMATLQRALEIIEQPTPADHVGNLVSLSKREVHVLKLMEEGLSNADNARRLGISVRTVHRHALNIYRKLGVHSRTAAIRTLRT